MTVASDGIARAFNRSGALDIFEAFDMVWHAGLLFTYLSLMQFQVGYLALFVFSQ